MLYGEQVGNSLMAFRRTSCKAIFPRRIFLDRKSLYYASWLPSQVSEFQADSHDK